MAMFRFIDLSTNIGRINSHIVRIGVGVAMLLASDARDDAKVQTHPPQRPLPKAVEGTLNRGPAYFVDPAQGDDANDGSREKPWKSLQHGARHLKPGDTLYLRGGIYYEKVYLTRSGTQESPIVIAAYPGELPVLDGGLREFLESSAESWEPAKEGAPGEYVSTKAYPDAADRQPPHQFLPGSWEPLWGIEEQRPLALGHFADSMVPLHGYRTLADLRSTNEFWPKSKKAGRSLLRAGVVVQPGDEPHPHPFGPS